MERWMMLIDHDWWYNWTYEPSIDYDYRYSLHEIESGPRSNVPIVVCHSSKSIYGLWNRKKAHCTSSMDHYAIWHFYIKISIPSFDMSWSAFDLDCWCWSWSHWCRSPMARPMWQTSICCDIQFCSLVENRIRFDIVRWWCWLALNYNSVIIKMIINCWITMNTWCWREIEENNYWARWRLTIE